MYEYWCRKSTVTTPKSGPIAHIAAAHTETLVSIFSDFNNTGWDI